MKVNAMENQKGSNFLIFFILFGDVIDPKEENKITQFQTDSSGGCVLGCDQPCLPNHSFYLISSLTRANLESPKLLEVSGLK